MSEPGTREQRGAGTPELSDEHPNSAPPPPPPPPATGLDNKVSVLAYLVLSLHVFFFSTLIAAAPDTFRELTREDYWVEYLTAVWFLLAGCLLFGTAWREPSLFRRCVYILGGMAMLFAAGEEISWGQRIFGFATPDFLLTLNQQGEFNAHNISLGTFDRIYRDGAFLLFLATSVAFFCRKDRLFGIPFPSILLTLGFLAILSYDSGAGLRDLLDFIVFKHKGLLLLLLIFALFSGQSKLVIAAAATLTLVFALSYVNYHNVYQDSIVNSTRIQEIREYLFGLGCLFYALELALAQAPGRLAAIMPAPFTGRQLPSRWIPGRLMTGSLVIAGSIGLMVFQYFNPIAAAREAAARAEYAALVSGEPAIRADYDVYRSDNRLVYAKVPCARADTNDQFFLAVYPVDVADLPGPRRTHGFDNLDFPFNQHGSRFGDFCLAVVPLPEYAIATIGTGQYVTLEGGFKHLWEGEFSLKEGR